MKFLFGVWRDRLYRPLTCAWKTPRYGLRCARLRGHRGKHRRGGMEFAR